MDATYRIGRQRRWWLWYAPLLCLAGIGSLLPGWSEWIVRGPVLLAGVLLFDGHARAQRDDQARRVQISSGRATKVGELRSGPADLDWSKTEPDHDGDDER